ALDNPVVDTLVVSRALLGGRCGLGSAARRLGLAAPHLHRALADARLTAQLWLLLAGVLADAGRTLPAPVPGARAGARRAALRRWRSALARVVERVDAARVRGEALRVAVRAAHGEPMDLRLRIIARSGSRCVGFDLDRDTDIAFDISRVIAVRA